MTNQPSALPSAWGENRLPCPQDQADGKDGGADGKTDGRQTVTPSLNLGWWADGQTVLSIKSPTIKEKVDNSIQKEGNSKHQQHIEKDRLPVCLLKMPVSAPLSQKTAPKPLSRTEALFDAEHPKPLEDSEPIPWGEPMDSAQFAIVADYVDQEGQQFRALHLKPPRVRIVRHVLIQQPTTKMIPVPLDFAQRWLRPVTPTIHSTRPIDRSGDPLDL